MSVAEITDATNENKIHVFQFNSLSLRYWNKVGMPLEYDGNVLLRDSRLLLHLWIEIQHGGAGIRRCSASLRGNIGGISSSLCNKPAKK